MRPHKTRAVAELAQPKILPVRSSLGLVALLLGIYSMAVIVQSYFGLHDHDGFLIFKQKVVSWLPWRLAFYTHVFLSLFALIPGIFLFSSYVQTHFAKFHRGMGKIYVIAVLFFNAPAALILALYANGGWPARLSFLVLDGLWFAFTLKALQFAQNKDFSRHRKFMIRSYALTLSALSFRLLKPALVSFVGSQDSYVIRACLSWPLNWIIAEVYLQRCKYPKRPAKAKTATASRIETPTKLRTATK